MMKVRRGISLIELLLVMSAASVVLTLSASLIHRLLHAQTTAASIADVERSALRLGEAFRRDVHQATRVSVGSTDDLLFGLEMPDDQTIEYRSQPTAVQRIVSKGKGVVARELFAFPITFRAECSANESRLVTLSVRSVPDGNVNERRREAADDLFIDWILHTEAMLNRDSR